GCGSGADMRLARRILEDHRRLARDRPLPGSQVIRLALFSPTSAATGTQQIEWDSRAYRETISSGGATTVRGIQGGKAYFTDEDGVTRVVSEPVLAELVTRSYFWRRAYLFEDAERAKIALGPADAIRVSLRMKPREGNPLTLTFDRRDLRLLSARSPGLDLEFESPTRWRDASRRGAPVRVEHRRTGLPTGILPDAAAGGWSAVWRQPIAEAPLVGPRPEEVAVRATVAGQALVLAIDAAADGPIRIRPAAAARLGLTFSEDVFGRRLARGARLAIADWSEPSVFVEISDDVPPGAEGALGAALFRETTVEYDAAGRRLRLLDPARWVRPEGYFRSVIDDDGDRPVAILTKGREALRVLAGASAATALTLAPESALRVGLAPGARTAEGFRWGPAPLPSIDLDRKEALFDPSRGDDGRLSARFLLRFQAIIDMPHRWAYLKPETGAPANGL
ncbi:MAG: hypothetical protein M3R62_15370, partial [Acidobacteriota bacterium]|nr:hypothetical protein [Acidobacteriota bacterium]